MKKRNVFRVLLGVSLLSMVVCMSSCRNYNKKTGEVPETEEDSIQKDTAQVDTAMVVDSIPLDTAQVADTLAETKDLDIDTMELKADVKPEKTYDDLKAEVHDSNYTRKPIRAQFNPAIKGRKIVYLTFDDGPSPQTPKVLQILKENGVHATFFVTAQMPKCFGYIKQAYEEGNAIAPHSYTHHYDIYTSYDTYFADMDRINEVIEQQTGTKSRVFRFPGGSSNHVFAHYNHDPYFMINLAAEAQRRGYQYVDWNVDSQDASGNHVSTDVILRSACKATRADVCVLMHDAISKSTTVEALPEIIKFFKDCGYEFGTLTSTSYMCHHGVNPYGGGK